MKEKYKCRRCQKMAVWVYAPRYMGSEEKDNYYCDDHVSRGCSCNYDVDAEGNCIPDSQYLDRIGRELPCCEYDYNEEGYEIDLEEDETASEYYDDSLKE